MFVVVYLCDAKKHTIIPEEFVYILNQKSLKNCGVNSNQNRRIYFSSEWFREYEQKLSPKREYEPKFDLDITNVYPLPNDLIETCFVARLYCFEGKKSIKIPYNIQIFSTTKNLYKNNLLTCNRYIRRCIGTLRAVTSKIATHLQPCTFERKSDSTS